MMPRTAPGGTTVAGANAPVHLGAGGGPSMAADHSDGGWNRAQSFVVPTKGSSFCTTPFVPYHTGAAGAAGAADADDPASSFGIAFALHVTAASRIFLTVLQGSGMDTFFASPPRLHTFAHARRHARSRSEKLEC